MHPEIWNKQEIKGISQVGEQAGGGRKLGHARYTLSKRVAVWSQAVVVEMRRGNWLGCGRGWGGMSIWMTCLKSIGFSMNCMTRMKEKELHISR